MSDTSIEAVEVQLNAAKVEIERLLDYIRKHCANETYEEATCIACGGYDMYSSTPRAFNENYKPEYFKHEKDCELMCLLSLSDS